MTAAICGLFLLVFFLLRRRPHRWMRAACLLAVTCVTAAELSAAGAVTLRKFEEYTDSGYREFVLSGSETVLAVQQADGGSYRMEKNFYRTFNDPMLLGYFGTSHYGSTQKEEEQGLLIRLGYCPNLYANGASVASDALLGIRYLFTRPGEDAPNAAVLQREDITAPWTVWQNPYALPLVQLCSDRWLDQALPEDPFGFQNALFSALTGEETLVQQPVEIREGTDGLTFTCPRDGIYSFVAFDGQTGELQINGSARGDYFGLFTPSGSVQELGRYAAGEQVTVSVEAAARPRHRCSGWMRLLLAGSAMKKRRSRFLSRSATAGFRPRRRRRRDRCYSARSPMSRAGARRSTAKGHRQRISADSSRWCCRRENIRLN